MLSVPEPYFIFIFFPGKKRRTALGVMVAPDAVTLLVAHAGAAVMVR